MNISPSDYNVISSLDNDDDSSVTYFCNYCNTRLHYQSTDELTSKKIFYCLKCGIEFIPANQLVRKANKFETPAGPDRELLTATPNEEPKASPTKYVGSQQDLPPLFKALESAGLKFKHYEEH